MSYNCKNHFDDEGDTLVIGGRLVIEKDAVIEGLPGGSDATSIAAQGNSSASSVAQLRDDFNALLEKLRAAGLMESAE